jgi:hypothetical protein
MAGVWVMNAATARFSGRRLSARSLTDLGRLSAGGADRRVDVLQVRYFGVSFVGLVVMARNAFALRSR